MEAFEFEIHGVTVAFRAETRQGRKAIALLDRDFAAFACRRSAVRRSTIEVCFVTGISDWERLPALFQTLACRVRGWGPRRVCDYDGVIAEATREKDGARRFRLAGRDVSHLREVAYTAVLSALGEELDLRGFHRMHGFAFQAPNGGRGVLVAPTGAGKSALATLLCTKTGHYRLYSDESPLASGSLLYEFPIRLALAPRVAKEFGLPVTELFRRKVFQPKALFPFPRAIAAAPGTIDVLLIARIVKRAPSIAPIGVFAAVPELFLSLVVGLGLAQMSEWMLRIDAIPRLVWIAFRRTGTMVALLWNAKTILRFEMCHDAYANARLLDGFMSPTGRAPTPRVARELRPPEPLSPRA